LAFNKFDYKNISGFSRVFLEKAFAENQPDAAAASTFAGKISILGPSGLHSLNNLLKYSIFLVFKCFYWTFYG
jgi:hypothetical protein